MGYGLRGLFFYPQRHRGKREEGDRYILYSFKIHSSNVINNEDLLRIQYGGIEDSLLNHSLMTPQCFHNVKNVYRDYLRIRFMYRAFRG